jgi:hypothetical protein
MEAFMVRGNDLRRKIPALLWCIIALGLGPQVQRPVASDHRDRFPQYKDLRNIRDADLSTLAQNGPVKLVVAPPHGELDPSSIGRPAVDYLREYGCASDIVVVATPRSLRSDFTAEGTFIFTEYELAVDTVLRGSNLLPGSPILVVWPGGSVTHKSRSITVTDASYGLLAIGKKYLLFLRQINNDFETVQKTAGYDLTGSQAESLGVGPLREQFSSNSLLAVTQAAVSGCNR